MKEHDGQRKDEHNNLAACSLVVIRRLRAFDSALRVSDVAGLLSVSKQSVYRLMHHRGLPHFIDVGGYRIDPGALAEWLLQRYIGA